MAENPFDFRDDAASRAAPAGADREPDADRRAAGGRAAGRVGVAVRWVVGAFLTHVGVVAVLLAAGAAWPHLAVSPQYLLAPTGIAVAGGLAYLCWLGEGPGSGGSRPRRSGQPERACEACGGCGTRWVPLGNGSGYVELRCAGCQGYGRRLGR